MKKKIPADSKEKPHPPYFHMIKDALVELKEKNGSSSYAIGKKIEEKYKYVLPDNFRRMLSVQLKNSVVKGNLVKIRASYKLLETNKMTTRQQEQQKKKKRKTRKTVSVSKPEVATKKKRLLAKKPRQLKSIKSPVTKKKAMKASAA